jgi:tryptophan synthase alpha chain
MSSIADAFSAARSNGRAALMPYLMGGFPDADTAAAVADAYVDAGADLVELGVPFSDPLADGPVIHDAATRALAAGASLDAVLRTCEQIADRVPVVPMVYANMALARGPEALATALAEAGAAGAIVPDLPPDEGSELAEALKRAELALVPLVAPTSSPERRRQIAAEAEGFVYVVSDTRTTGERDRLPQQLADLVAAVRDDSPVPVAVGFGIGTPEQAAAVGDFADGVIIGSRLVRAAGEAGSPDQAARATGEFIRDCREAMS